GRWQQVCEAAGVEFVSPQQDSRQTLARLRASRLVLADAMHAAICADTLRVPWVPLSISSENHSFKWVDWTSSMEVPYQPRQLPPSSFLEKLQSDLAVLVGTDYRLQDASQEQAMAFHTGTLLRRSSIRMAVGRRAVTSGLFVLALLLRLPGLSSLHRALDGRQFSKAVQAMKDALNAPGFLSRQEVFEARLAEMKRRLDDGMRRART